MTKAKKRMVLDVYNQYDTDDISTERLLQIVADICGCDVTDVVDVLREDSMKSKGNKKGK